MKTAARHVLLGMAAGLPVTLIVGVVRVSFANLDRAIDQGPPVSWVGVLATQLGMSALGGWVGYRWGWRNGVRRLLTGLSLLGIPSVIIGGWMAYWRVVGRLL